MFILLILCWLNFCELFKRLPTSVVNCGFLFQSITFLKSQATNLTAVAYCSHKVFICSTFSSVMLRLSLQTPQTTKTSVRLLVDRIRSFVRRYHYSNYKFIYLCIVLCSGTIDGNNQLIIKGKFNGSQIETVLRAYISK